MDAHDRSLLERINPVYKTAKTTLFQLSLAGDADARALVARLGLTFERTQGPSSSEDARLQAQANAVFLETRYRTMQAMAQASGAATIVDLPCGYTPRGLACARKGTAYVGLDLPATISELEGEVMALAKGEERALMRYVGIDATNPASLEAALRDVVGPVCVTCEGLLMYFQESEAAALCEGIRRLLLAHGGCWICADPEMILQNLEIMRAVVGERYREVFESTRRAHEMRADVHVEDPVLMVSPEGDVPSSIGRVQAFLVEHGLLSERVSIARHMPEIESLKALGPEVEERVRQGMEACAYWRCTPLGGKARTAGGTGSVPFDVSCETVADLLEMSLKGRVDTLTSPEVLELFERRAKGGAIRRVVLDCSGMTYISSAGLRVLLIMCKRCGGNVTLTGVSPEVMDILGQSGFADIVTLL